MSGKLAATACALAFALAMGAPGALAQDHGGAWEERERDDALMNEQNGVDETRLEELQERLQETEQEFSREVQDIQRELEDDQVDETRLEELQDRLDEARDDFQDDLQDLREEMDDVLDEARVPEDDNGLDADETRLEERVLDDLREAEQRFGEDLDRAEQQLTDDVMRLDEQIQGQMEAVIPDEAEEPEDLWGEIEEAIIPDPAARPAIDRTWMAEGTIGLNNFTGDLNDNLRGGFGYGARGVWNANETLGAEVGYVGGFNQTEGTALVEVGNWVFTNGVDAAARLSWVNETMFRPFAVGGLGVLHLNSFARTEADLPATTVQFGDAFMMTVPLGVGIAAFPGDEFVVGTRFDYRIQTGILDNELPSGDNWTLGINAGWTF